MYSFKYLFLLFRLSKAATPVALYRIKTIQGTMYSNIYLVCGYTMRIYIQAWQICSFENFSGSIFNYHIIATIGLDCVWGCGIVGLWDCSVMPRLWLTFRMLSAIQGSVTAQKSLAQNNFTSVDLVSYDFVEKTYSKSYLFFNQCIELMFFFTINRALDPKVVFLFSQFL